MPSSWHAVNAPARRESPLHKHGVLEGYAKALAQLCRESELSITETARRAKITRGQLHKGLSGESELSIGSLGRILEALGKNLIDLTEVMEIQQGRGPSSRERDYFRRMLLQLGMDALRDDESRRDDPRSTDPT